MNNNITSKVNQLATSAAGDTRVDKAPPLEDFNNAYETVYQVQDRLIGLLVVLKGKDTPIRETPPYPQNIYELLVNMPDNIRSECNSINEHITELEKILLT